jgi:peptide/nickel transport system permease protein
VTFRKAYVTHENRPIELELFTRGAAYELWGLIPTNIHFFGVDRQAYFDAHGKEANVPAFFFLGADKYGRDIFTRALYGSRISLSVGFIGLLGTFALGMVLGGISGYAGGRVDDLIQRFIEILQSFPQLPLWIALAAILPGDWSSLAIYFSITLLLSLLNWTGLARVVRGKILALREEDYAVAARLLGASHRRILFLHLMPGFTSHIIVSLTLSVPVMILGETALSFLGLGLRPPLVSWGVMLQSCMDVKAVSFYPWLLTPVLFIIVLVLSFNFLGDGIRDAADPYGGR